MNEEMTTILSKFGFSDIETEIYLSVLRLGTPSVTEIANAVGKGRTATYFHIEKLKEKGLLLETRRGKRRFYTALEPKKFAHLLESWTTSFKHILPELDMQHILRKESPHVEIFESRAGYTKIYEEISLLPDGATFRVLEGARALEHELQLLSQKEWEYFFSRLVNKNIKTKALFTKESYRLPKTFLSETNKKLLNKRSWDLRIISEKKLPVQQLMFMYADKIAFLFPETSLVVTIRHTQIHDFLAAIFDLLHTLGTRADAWK